MTRLTLINQMTYASPAWIGFANSSDLSRLQAPLNRAYRWGLSFTPDPTLFQSLCDKADQVLFRRVTAMDTHVLHTLLPPKQKTTHNLRPRLHPYVLPVTSNSMQRNFFHRLLFQMCNVKSKARDDDLL